MNSAQIKQCSKCLMFKDLCAFGKRKERHSGDGLHSRCKSCESEYHKARYLHKRDEELQRCAALNKKYRSDWEAFFIQEYGPSPRCEVCDLVLQYNGQRGDKNIVYWDHRHDGAELITMSPKRWLANRSCSQENISIWRQSDFGILCNPCNSRLPTKDRVRWLEKITHYIQGVSNGVGV
jgi:hypothetical protein